MAERTRSIWTRAFNPEHTFHSFRLFSVEFYWFSFCNDRVQVQFSNVSELTNWVLEKNEYVSSMSDRSTIPGSWNVDGSCIGHWENKFGEQNFSKCNFRHSIDREWCRIASSIVQNLFRTLGPLRTGFQISWFKWAIWIMARRTGMFVL